MFVTLSLLRTHDTMQWKSATAISGNKHPPFPVTAILRRQSDFSDQCCGGVCCHFSTLVFLIYGVIVL